MERMYMYWDIGSCRKRKLSADEGFSTSNSTCSEIITRRKGVDGFSVETPGSGKHPFSPSSDSLRLLGNPLCTNFTITKLFVDYAMHSSFAYRQFNSNFTVVRRFCRMSSSTAEIVTLLVTTWACPGRAKSLMFTRHAS
ncbi:hypothetical protein AVEN_234622-1 [Araneus ventricosus]|uniref:Uncharacterized protein n=1 Tax=Araneus ventricosus TaxID=182803 RepID=A0A4Y2SAN8_ARAVE|nr:hypothetical protein AVEN_234622-1 [Araneus ventricosus]